ncbi:transcriptional regulator, partial [Xanthomonas citri pv. citri]|nr:transcriptional regulator [Xanthomonas citri pv. citri]
HPAMLDLLDAFDGGAEGELRQVLVDPAAGHVDIAVTVRKLDE